MAWDRDAILARIRARLEADFPVGCRVRATAEAIGANVIKPKDAKRRGTVIGYSHGVSPNVLWDGRKTPSGYAPHFVERLGPARPRLPR